jgi:hypothetical protein
MLVQLLHRRATAASLLAVAVAFCAAADIANAGTRRITVRVYDTSPLDDASREVAIATTTRILEQAGISSDWRECRGATGSCEEPRRKGELVLRLVPTHVANYDPQAGSIAARRHKNDTGLSLAFAVVEPRTRVGALATVFFDRVKVVADRAGVELPSLLGRTIAHEIGHLLLGTMGHSRGGLMREIWTDDELVRDNPESWRFSITDRRNLHQGLRRLQ